MCDLQVCHLRKQYVPMYITCLQNGEMGGNSEIEEMDAQLPEPSIKVFRRLAHAKVRSGLFSAICYQVQDPVRCFAQPDPDASYLHMCFK